MIFEKLTITRQDMAPMTPLETPGVELQLVVHPVMEVTVELETVVRRNGTTPERSASSAAEELTLLNGGMEGWAHGANEIKTIPTLGIIIIWKISRK